MECNIFFIFQDNYNVLHVSAMYSREDVVKLLLTKKGVDPYATGGVSIILYHFKLIPHLLHAQRLLVKLRKYTQLFTCYGVKYEPWTNVSDSFRLVRNKHILLTAFLVLVSATNGSTFSGIPANRNSYINPESFIGGCWKGYSAQTRRCKYFLFNRF